MFHNKDLKDFIKMVQKICSSKSLGQVCKDIVLLKALDYRLQMFGLKINKERMRNHEVDLTPLHVESAKVLKEINGIEDQYSKDELDKIKECKDHLDQIYQKVGFCDLIGELFGEMNLLNKEFGQFFTPYPISRLMAQLNGVGRNKKEDPYTILDPTCGAGGMLIACADVLSSAGIDLKESIYTGCDIDRFCVAMTYLQLCEYDLAATVIWSNALTNEIWEIWETPTLVVLDAELPLEYASK